MKCEGVVTHWNEARGFGFVSITRAQRFYFHVSEVIDGPVGSLLNLPASFETDNPNAKSEPGSKKLPKATKVRIVTPQQDGGENE